ncbi:predicted protein [Nematostella vectensis]|uniref:G-protein coupled receptors family 1 profile domain-containing protein n=1 Tax=Nematostella vectensis TaxID=45351 RepID=A7RZT8_NEMVE|nr:galanin receptor type 1 [Nematostella vectensis]XP_032240479.1 galanin receptor type 1 [Nematostella vectensis]XP_032240480.1 galanin receptor type 1 [Nematostella vectensis]EDO43048.1 predicted protein [Nematostella vectensis]|eukprot:XP_001635111.1 predicted protein [Nematostella vectensis]
MTNTTTNSSNYTNSSSPLLPHKLYTSFYQEPLALVVARLALEVGIALAGLGGNILVIVVIASKRLRSRSSMNSYIMNLAIADLGVLTIIFPIAVMKERIPLNFPLGKFVCLYLIPCVDTFYGASIWLITSIAFQRYMNIVRASVNMHQKTSSHVGFHLAAVWIASFFVVSLPLFFIMAYSDSGQHNFCIPDWRNVKPFEPIYIITLVVFTYVLPLVIISWTYIGIWREIGSSTRWHESRRTSGTTASDSETQRMRENSRAKRILTPIVLTFATCMLPVNIFRLLTYFWRPVLSTFHFWTFYNAMVFITILNSAANPLIYSIVSQDFRRAFMGLIFKRCNVDKNSVYTQMSRVNGSFRGSNTKKDVSFSPQTWPEAKTLKESVI